MFSGIIAIDGNRIRFAVKDMKAMLAMKMLSIELRDIQTKFFRNPGRILSRKEKKWYDIWQDMFSRRSVAAEGK